MDKKRTLKFLEYVKDFEFTDLIAFATILEVKEIEDFNEFLTNITIKFNEINREHRRQLLKLAKDISLNNKDKQKFLKEEAANAENSKDLT